MSLACDRGECFPIVIASRRFHATDISKILSTRFVALVSLALASELLADSPPEQPLNFVVFLVDDLGYMDIGANNPDCFYETPNIDRLAESGMRFTDGYAANPVCSPTRYSLMTGKYPTRVAATNFFSGKRGGRFNPAPLNSNMPLDEITVTQ